ncbi:MAG: outer membrane beta-barrel protein [Flammeovirgaceae bacterium]
MKIKTALWSITLLATTVIELAAQKQFDKGYYITNSGQRIECLIKNLEWKNNPSSFKYKFSENQEEKIATVSDVKEFGVEGSFKYVVGIVEIDQSSDIIGELDNTRGPKWVTDTLFLKTIVKGPASLFSFESERLTRYFYYIDNSALKQLVYKKYVVPSTLAINENAQFRQQLWNELKCGNVGMNYIKKLPYRKTDLTKYFIEFNICKGDSLQTQVYKQRRGQIAFWLTSGVNYSSVSSLNSLSKTKTDFGSQINFSFGLELEFTLPYNKNKWSIIVDPTYQYFYSTTSSGYAVKLNTIELPTGVRHSFFLKGEKRIFINAFFISNFSLNLGSTTSISEFKWYDNPSGTKYINPDNSLAIGVGIDLKRLRTEVHYYTDRELQEGYPIISVPYSRTSLIFAYRLFTNKQSK